MDESIYSTHAVSIPTPKFVVFYNGLKRMPEQMVVKLSDEYEVKRGEPDLELKVRIININPGYNKGILESCRILYEYCLYVECVRKYIKDMPAAEAVGKAVDECIKMNVLSDFLKKQKAEVVAMSIFEYDEDVELKKLRASEHRYGQKEGEAIGKRYMAVSQVCKKLQKGYTTERIANELEIDEEKIEMLCSIAQKYSPDYNVDKICREAGKRNLNF